MQKQKPIFDKRIFWDVDFNKINYEKYPAWVIVRVFERGDIPDIKQLRSYYGDKLIKKEIVKAKYIEFETMQFLSAIYQIPKQKFRCYTEKQLRGEHSLY
ncbi:MAG: hypothetical protein SGI96_19625 [Bacteroidota bacterium]|nr:hypothetical protein [Bacteroidota bacterium]